MMQEIWPHIVNLLGAGFLLFLSGKMEGFMDYLQFRYEGDNKFWNPDLSWVNKWKDGNPLLGEAFWQSSRLLVFLTDGWHLCKFAMHLFMLSAIFLILVIFLSPGTALLITIVYRLLFGYGFFVAFETRED